MTRLLARCLFALLIHALRLQAAKAESPLLARSLSAGARCIGPAPTPATGNCCKTCPKSHPYCAISCFDPDTNHCRSGTHGGSTPACASCICSDCSEDCCFHYDTVPCPNVPPPTPPPTPAPKYACDYKTLKCKEDPHGGSGSMEECSKTCCDIPLNCGMYNNTEICGHKYTICDVCDTCCHEWIKPQNICDACVADECTSGRNPDCCVSFECEGGKCQRAFRATGTYQSLLACEVACGGSEVAMED
jgi:hypothetical protein